jgi:nicotinate-nucleotide adenylyltransferase
MTGGRRAPPLPVGVLGGTFDPVHVGHLEIAERVRSRLGLSRMLLLPTARPPHKAPGELAPVADRAAMLRLALRDVPALEICALELDPNRVSYTVDSLRALRCGDPTPCLPLFVLGMDALAQIASWRSSDAILGEFDLVVVDRPDRRRSDLDPRVAQRIVELPADLPPGLAPGTGGRIFHLPLVPIPVSSSVIRRRAARGEDLSGLVPPAVAEYIERTGLYRKESRR